MSVQGELYRSYDSFVDGRMYQSMGSEMSVGMHQAAQFVQVIHCPSMAIDVLISCVCAMHMRFEYRQSTIKFFHQNV